MVAFDGDDIGADGPGTFDDGPPLGRLIACSVDYLSGCREGVERGDRVDVGVQPGGRRERGDADAFGATRPRDERETATEGEPEDRDPVVSFQRPPDRPIDVGRLPVALVEGAVVESETVDPTGGERVAHRTKPPVAPIATVPWVRRTRDDGR